MFEVEPWEVESDEVKFESIQIVEWQGAVWNLGLDDSKSRWPKIVLWRDGKPLMRALTDIGPLSSPLHIPLTEVGCNSIQDVFIDCMINSNWKRQFFMNESCELRQKGETTRFSLTLWPKGTGSWGDEANPRSYSTLFKWAVGENNFLAEAPVAEVLTRIEGEADCVFARRFLLMSHDESWREMWTWKNGDHHELQRVLMWAFLAQEELWQMLTGLHLTVDMAFTNVRDGSRLSSDQCQIKNYNQPNRHQLPIALQEAIGTALAWFGSQLNTSQVEKHLCLEQLLGEGEWLIVIQPSNPSAHERIEAAIKWRDWLAEHEPSA